MGLDGALGGLRHAAQIADNAANWYRSHSLAEYAVAVADLLRVPFDDALGRDGLAHNCDCS